ncbi:MAG: hypothetical protein OQJ89_11050 [Kangiellaceae bacterium]|nr:hypothetical protein [Kangiellaceae bacterium]MCW9017494.1 hypothetical protein [Kangiellaceae bacterium]
MSNTIIQPNHALIMKAGPGELVVTNSGSGEANYRITYGGNPAQTQKLSGPGSMQSYEGVTYPVEIDNLGPDSISVS